MYGFNRVDGSLCSFWALTVSAQVLVGSPCCRSSVCSLCFQSVEGTPLLTLLKDPYILISAGKMTLWTTRLGFIHSKQKSCFWKSAGAPRVLYSWGEARPKLAGLKDKKDKFIGNTACQNKVELFVWQIFFSVRDGGAGKTQQVGSRCVFDHQFKNSRRTPWTDRCESPADQITLVPHLNLCARLQGLSALLTWAWPSWSRLCPSGWCRRCAPQSGSWVHSFCLLLRWTSKPLFTLFCIFKHFAVISVTTSTLISFFVSGIAFLPASVSYLIGTNLFGVLANKMGR